MSLGLLSPIIAGLVLGMAPAPAEHQATLKVIPVGQQTSEPGPKKLAQLVIQSLYDHYGGRFRVAIYLEDPEIESILSEQYSLYAFKNRLSNSDLLARIKKRQSTDLILFVGLDTHESRETLVSKDRGRAYFVDWQLLGSAQGSFYCYSYHPFDFLAERRAMELRSQGWMMLVDLDSYSILYLGSQDFSETNQVQSFLADRGWLVRSRVKAGATPAWSGPDRVPAPRLGRTAHPGDYVSWWSEEEIQALLGSSARHQAEARDGTLRGLAAWIAAKAVQFGKEGGQ